MTRHSALVGLATVLAVLAYASGLPYSKDSGVIALNKDNFAKEVFSSEHIWLVEFYAPWCGHCKKLAPEWEKLAKSMEGIIKVGAVNGDDEANRELAAYYQIRGFPTIKFFGSKIEPTPDGKGYHKVAVDYNGPRTAAALAKFATDQMPSFVTKVTDKNIEDFLSGDLAKVILFTNKKETTTLYKALSIDFHYQLKLGEVRDTEKDLVERYGVTKFPTLMIITPSGEQLTYSGELKHKAIFQFLKPHAKMPEGRYNTESQSAPPPPPPEPVHAVREEVTTQEQFEKICFNTNKNCLISFLDPENYDAEELEKQIKILEAVQEKQGKFFNFLWVNGIKHPEFINTWSLAEAYPSAVIFNHKKSSIVPYIGAFSEESLNEFLDKILRGLKRAVPITKIPTMDKPKDEL